MNTSLVNLYRALVGLRTHHDRMLWSRVQTLIVVQGAVIGGSYAVGDHQLAAGFLTGGVVLSLVIYELVVKDQMDRDTNDRIIETLGDKLLPEELVEELGDTLNRQPLIRMSAIAPRWRPFLRGRYLIRLVLWAFIGFDLFLAILHFYEIAPVSPMTG